MAYLQVGVQNLSFQGLILPIRGDLSRPNKGSFEGLEGGVVWFELLGKQWQKLRHVHTAKGALACMALQ